MPGRPLALRGAPLPFPAVCAPLVARTGASLLAECAAVSAKRPDLLEWRIDFFEGLRDAAEVARVARELKACSQGLPLLLTRRHAREGGEAIAAGEGEVIAAYRSVCAAGAVEFVDFEMDNDPAHVHEVRALSRDAGVQLVLSFHDFDRTPPAAELFRRFARAEMLGADVAKVAVMPRSQEDVLALLAATAQAGRELAIPVAGMAMGPLGAVTRACGWLFGSALTFAVGASASAPGQMPIEDVRAAIALLRRAG